MSTLVEGNLNSKILFVSDYQRLNDKAEGQVLGGPAQTLFQNACLREGLTSDDYALTAVISDAPKANKFDRFTAEEHEKWRQQLYSTVKSSKANIIVPLGRYANEVITGNKSINKWQLSVTPARVEFGARKSIGLFNPNDIARDPSLSPYLYFGITKVKAESEASRLTIPKRKFILNPDFDDTMSYLLGILRHAEEISIDFETGRGQINTIGFAISPTEAIAIQTLPERLEPKKYYQLMSRIRRVCESDIPKNAQNALYEQMWAALYGIQIKNVTCDTMWLMKFIYPELNMGLDNVGRLWTPFPYWKDDNESWNDIRDWRKHFSYNCCDTTGTFWAKNEMIKEVKDRGLYDLWNDFVMKFYPVISEMCQEGLPLNVTALDSFRSEVMRKLTDYESKILMLIQEQTGETINLRSHTQLKKSLKAMGIDVPMVRDKKTGEMKPSTDKKALTKLKKKYPKEEVIGYLLKFSKENKLNTSYVNFGYDADSRVRYHLGGCNTETGRWNCKNDFRGNGFNAQTVPKKVRHIFQAEEGRLLLEIDLSQAESRYVAWEAPEEVLMKMLRNREDIHRFVASNIFKKLPEFITDKERQLGKKSGHAANYSVGVRTFAEACAVEMDIWLSETEARNILEGYHSVFPGIRKRQRRIEADIRRHRFLRTPIGRERHFFGRMGDDTFREAYAYAPQSVIPDVTNSLMIYLWNVRNRFNLDFKFLLQVHDSMLLNVKDDPETVRHIIRSANCSSLWHPRIELPGGILVIPTDIKIGKSWGTLDKLNS